MTSHKDNIVKAADECQSVQSNTHHTSTAINNGTQSQGPRPDLTPNGTTPTATTYTSPSDCPFHSPIIARIAAQLIKRQTASGLQRYMNAPNTEVPYMPGCLQDTTAACTCGQSAEESQRTIEAITSLCDELEREQQGTATRRSA